MLERLLDEVHLWFIHKSPNLVMCDFLIPHFQVHPIPSFLPWAILILPLQTLHYLVRWSSLFSPGVA